jgi:hypothetical protein
MKVENIEWLDFKKKVIAILTKLEFESQNLTLPIGEQELDEFRIKVDECEVFPTFIKKQAVMKVEYDFSLCNTNIRLLSVSTLGESLRIEVRLKNNPLYRENL